MQSVLAATLCFAAALAASAMAAPTDNLTDVQLRAYAIGLFRGDPSISPDRNEHSIMVVGVHNGAEVEAIGVPCVKCAIGGVAIYYKTVRDSRTCDQLGGVGLRYRFGGGVVTDLEHDQTVCVPGVLDRAGIVGEGQPSRLLASGNLTDDELVALAKEVLDINNQWLTFDFSGRIYRGQRIDIVRPHFAPQAVGFLLLPGVSCDSVGGVERPFSAEEHTQTFYKECIPKILDDENLDRGVIKRGVEFNEEEARSIDLQPVFGPSIPLLDADLADYASIFFKGGASVTRFYGPHDNQGNEVVGVHNAVPIESSVGRCQYCQIDAAAIYYRTPGGSALCAKIGGRAVLYPLKPSTGFRWGRFCVPALLISSKTYGQGVLDDGRPGVVDVKSLPAFNIK